MMNDEFLKSQKKTVCLINNYRTGIIFKQIFSDNVS